MSFPRYPKYKDSGVEWLGEVPEHWHIMPLKRVTSLKSGDSITSDSIREEGEYPVFGGNGIRGFTDGFTHEGHHVVLGRQGALCGNVNYASGRFWASEHAVVARPLIPAETRWLGEMLRAMNLNQYSVTAAQPGLSMEFVGNLRSMVPPFDEQAAIASFLDRETAKIDALIAEQQRLIELLQEKRQAVISHAVTKGLNPNAPMKDSGIEWLGEVPEHWGITRINFVADGFIYGTSVDCNSSESGTPVLRIPNIKEGFVDFADLKFASLPPDEEQRYVLRRNDILVVRTNGNPALVGKSAIYADDRRMLFASYLIKITPRPCVVPEFLSVAMNAACTREMLTLSARTSAGNYNMNCAGLGKTPIALPPITEQNEILNRLSVRLSEQESLLAEATTAISLLQERRSALISAAVTGQIDVRVLAGSEAA